MWICSLATDPLVIILLFLWTQPREINRLNEKNIRVKMTESNYFRFNHCIAQEVKFQTRMVQPQEANAKVIMHRSFNWGKLVFVLPILTTAYTLSSLILAFVFLYELIKCF